MIKPVGHLESCFREKFGTPRQSGFIKSAKARLTIIPQLGDVSVYPLTIQDCLEGIDDYSYIWLIFIFH